MKILISGSSGQVGSALCISLESAGHKVSRLVRHPTQKAGTVVWDPTAEHLESSTVRGFDAVVHLAGENIGTRRWSTAKKARIRDSRIHGTRLLAEALAYLDEPPAVWVCASAIGYYGDRGSELLTEASSPGAGFLAEVCRGWEAATEDACEHGIRVVNLRIGVVLSPDGGALKQMLVPFRWGLGGRVGSGRQFFSWIALSDLVAVIEHVLDQDEVRGPLNAVAPNPVPQAELAASLGRVLGRLALVPLPAVMARLMFGEVADEMLLASTRVDAKRLLESGYRFQYPELTEFLRTVL